METSNGWGNRSGDLYIKYDATAISRRKFFVDTISSTSPESVIEFGCASGCNLRLFDKNIKLTGVDANKAAINRAKALYKNIKFIEADITKYSSTEKYDIVCSMGVLIHIYPELIKQTINNMIMSAKKEIILIEGHSNEKKRLSKKIGKGFRTVHDFDLLLPNCTITQLPLDIQKLRSSNGLYLIRYNIIK